jgi:hypothetical protein
VIWNFVGGFAFLIIVTHQFDQRSDVLGGPATAVVVTPPPVLTTAPLGLD